MLVAKPELARLDAANSTLAGNSTANATMNAGNQTVSGNSTATDEDINR